MSELYKKKRNIYSAWDYEGEVRELNEMSEKGWQLVKGSSFSRKYKKNDAVQYKYQLDYQPGIEDMARYIETFREQGWEYINSIWNGWHYFRKLYNPELPAEEYEIYTDKASLNVMTGKWVSLASRVCIFLGLMAVLMTILNIFSFNIPRLILNVAILGEFFWILGGVVKMKKSNGTRKAKNMRHFFAILFGSFLLYYILMFFRPEFVATTSSEYENIPSANSDKCLVWAEEEIKYTDFFKFKAEGTIDSPLTITLQEKDTKKIICQEILVPGKDKKVAFSKANLLLKPGKYVIKFSDFDGGKVQLKILLD